MTTPTRRKKCNLVCRQLEKKDLVLVNSAFHFLSDDGPREICFTIESKCKHVFEAFGDIDEDDTTFREYFQCKMCKERLRVQVTFGCPQCHGRHLQFYGICGSRYMLCPQKPIVPFLKEDVFGVQFEVLFMPHEDSF
jgi:hypothetical protein